MRQIDDVWIDGRWSAATLEDVELLETAPDDDSIRVTGQLVSKYPASVNRLQHLSLKTPPDPDCVVIISQLPKLQFLKLRYEQDSKGFEDNGDCFIKLLAHQTLTSLDMEFTRPSNEVTGVLQAVERPHGCHLKELKIGHPRGSDDEVRVRLATAVTALPRLEKLEVRNWKEKVAVDRLVERLALPDSAVSNFYFRSRFRCHVQLSSALEGSDCKLLKLGLLISKPHEVPAEEYKKFSDAIRISKVDNLELLIEGCADHFDLLQVIPKPMSSLHLIFVNSEISRLDIGRLFKSEVSKLHLSWYPAETPLGLATQLTEALPDCKLKELRIGGEEPVCRKDAEKIVQSLRNVSSPLRSLEIGDGWEGDTLSQSTEEILKLNNVLQDELGSEPLLPCLTSKLFVIGDSKTGKSTLAKRLTKGEKYLCCEANKLQVYDLGGPAEYHFLCHYFLKGSDKDVFLIVCQAPLADKEKTEWLKSEAEYWLSFVASHGRMSQRKPMVMVILNYFPYSGKPKDGNLEKDAVQKCEDIVSGFADMVEFTTPRVFGLDAKQQDQVRKLKQLLRHTTAMREKPKIPKPCDTLLRRLLHSDTKKYLCDYLKAARKPRSKKIVSLEELRTLVFPGEQPGSKMKAIVLSLHDIGEVIYFEQPSSKQFVLLDLWWFAREVVVQFMRPRQHQASIPYATAKDMLISRCHSEEHVGYMFLVLHKLGVVFLDKLRPIALPAMNREVPRWKPKGDFYLGRRFRSELVKFRMLPQGLFLKLQSNLTAEFSWFNAGANWVSFRKDGVQIVVKSGGSRYDMEWIDLLFCGDTAKKADPTFQQVKSCLLRACSEYAPTLQMEEYVIGPKSVENLSTDETCKLSCILEEASRSLSLDVDEEEEAYDAEPYREGRGLFYRHSWENRHSWEGEDFSQVFELLLPSERQEYKRDKLRKLEPIKYEVLDYVEDEELPASDSVFKKPSQPPGLKNELEVMKQELIRSFRTESFKAREMVLREVRILHRELKHTEESIMAELRRPFHSAWPKYPYLTDKKNILNVSKDILGRRTTLHFLCEHGRCHLIEGQRGEDVLIPSNLFLTSCKVLVPAVRLLYFASLLAKAAGKKVPFAKEIYKKLQSYKQDNQLIANHLQSLRKSSPSASDLEPFCKELLASKLGSNKHAYFESTFKLYEVPAGEFNQWVCSDHKKRALAITNE